ncbi:metal-sulfur cluster assembly factor [Piscinibacter sp.]|uniref:metal-sulfur cluster assembly factor n=1 Tax=Piscinibacter sp. TaxID=1903157 RepID=UPI0039E6F969
MDNTPEPVDAERRLALDALGRVSDPEIGESIVELGLVETLDITPARIGLALVLTSPTCPMGDAIADEAFQALQAVFPGREVEVFEAEGLQWDPSRLSPGARLRLGWNDERS